MTLRLRHSIVLSATALALVVAPVVLNGSAAPYLSGIDAMADNGKGGGNGNSGGGGNSGGNGGGNGNGGSNSSDSSSSTASVSSGGSENANRGKKNKQLDEVAVESAKLETGNKRSLNGELGRLNSLKRNINGLMNSSDPKMDGIREYIIANGTLVDAQAVLDDANLELQTAQSNYDAMVTTLTNAGYTDITPEALQTRLDEVNELLLTTPDDTALQDEQALLTSALGTIQALADAEADVADAEADVAEAEEAVSEEALREALLLAANPNRRSDTYLTDEIMAWASEQLGVGDDADGLIDDYLATR